MTKYQRTIDLLRDETIQKRKHDFLNIKKKLNIDDTAGDLQSKTESLIEIQATYFELLEVKKLLEDIKSNEKQ